MVWADLVDLEGPVDREDLVAQCHSHVEDRAQYLVRCLVVAPTTVLDLALFMFDLVWVLDHLAWDQEDQCHPS